MPHWVWVDGVFVWFFNEMLFVNDIECVEPEAVADEYELPPSKWVSGRMNEDVSEGARVQVRENWIKGG